LEFCNTHISKKAMKKGFVLTYDRMRRYEGRWHSEQKILFSAQIFLDSENGRLLSKEVENSSLLRGYKLFSVSKYEELFLKKLCGEGGNLEMSEGILRKGVPQIIRGPLKGMENRICKIDRHKRLAKVETSAFLLKPESGGQRKDSCAHFMEEWGFRYITAGLEITEKIV
jgi:transcriptional antiterminator NusG